MTTPRFQTKEQRKNDVQAMLAQATPEQLRRLLDDIKSAPLAEAVKYDA